MTESVETASDNVARRVLHFRKHHGWSAARLAEECARVGYPQLTASVIANIESGRRDKQGRRRRHVTVEELFAFAVALQTSPIVLLGPLGGPDKHLVEVPLHFDSSDEAVDFLHKINTLAGQLRASVPPSGREGQTDG
jgi:transcriptional regulator with XRE-family HTH domain